MFKKSNKFIPVTPIYHVGPIISIDICARKPIIASCGVDKCVKIWNYFTGNCELNKCYQEKIYSIALHPSGLFMLIGFSDKLRLMSILIDDIRELKEFYIKNCNEVCFKYIYIIIIIYTYIYTLVYNNYFINYYIIINKYYLVQILFRRSYICCRKWNNNSAIFNMDIQMYR